MRFLIGAVLVVIGTILMPFGDYPFDSLPHNSLELMTLSGLVLATGISILILSGGGRWHWEGG